MRLAARVHPMLGAKFAELLDPWALACVYVGGRP